MSPLTRANVLAYLRRPWASLEALERAHWRSESERDPLATFQASAALWEHVRDVGRMPSDDERHADLRAHVVLRQRLDRAANVLRGR